MRTVPSGIAQCPTPVPYQLFTRRGKQFCPTFQGANTVANPYCGCPWQSEQERCLSCKSPDTIQVRLLYPPTKCVEQPCHYVIPPVPCRKKAPPRRGLKSCSIDTNAEEPGPNDSYGLNGLNWYDWQMHEHNKESIKEPTREGISLLPAPEEFPSLVCQLPVECYSWGPGPVVCSSFFGRRVDHYRDWRCCTALPSRPWRPPFA